MSLRWRSSEELLPLKLSSFQASNSEMAGGEGTRDDVTEFHLSVAADLMVEKRCIENVKFMFWIFMHGLNENITEIEMWNKNSTIFVDSSH